MKARPSAYSDLRRKLIVGAAGSGVLAALGPARAFAAELGSMSALGYAELPDGTLAGHVLYALPGKVPLIKKAYRPPNFETPIEYFRSAITPNDAFFVRYHLAAIPEVKAADWKLAVGGEWGVGAMGNAVWRGVRLKDVLAKAGVKANALEVVFDGADHGVIDKTPDFVKSLPVEIALDENTLIAFEMNGKPLPH